MPNVNIPEAKTIALVRTFQKKRRRQLIKKNDGRGLTGEHVFFSTHELSDVRNLTNQLAANALVIVSKSLAQINWGDLEY